MADILALVVDDSRMARYVLSKMLKEQEINVDTVESAEEALGYLCNNLPDMVFMDHTMPGMDGFQAIRAIKNDPKTASIPIMMYTSKEGDVYMNQARALGAVDVLPKQLKPVQLIQVLERQQLLPRQIINKKQRSGPPNTESSTIEQENSSIDTPEIENTSAQSTTTAHTQASNETPPLVSEPPTPIVNASDIGQDLEQVTKDAERSIENQSFTNEVKQLLDEHREELAEQSSEHSQVLLNSLDKKIDTVSASLSAFIKETQENAGFFTKLSDNTKIFLIIINAIILIALGITTSQQTTEIKQLKSTNQTLKESFTVESAKSESEKSSLEGELTNNLYKNQLHLDQWVANLQWALNRKNQFLWNEKPFNKNLAGLLTSTAEKLNTAGFKGTINLTSHLGEFCLIANEVGDPELPVEHQTLSECTINGITEQQAEILGLEKTIQFNNFVAVFERQYDDNLRITLTSAGLSTPSVHYPDKNPEYSAKKWNDMAQQNQRVVIEFMPLQLEEPN
ncbi:hypothetical protein A9Q81_18310 [Gammaproteobacteria bacterium 42_54_T18]|nr:hypothetical protein A9Q81_18310 [Gammaproteobacteria bacterium 42_54_T18]